MRVIVKDFLDGKISRRGFMTRLSHAGFSALAVSSALRSVAPLAAASSSAGQILSESIIPFEGTGGEVLAEQLKAAGVRYVFLGKGHRKRTLCSTLRRPGAPACGSRNTVGAARRMISLLQ